MDANNRIRKLTLAISQNRVFLFLPSVATMPVSLLSYLFQMEFSIRKITGSNHRKNATNG